MTAKVIPISDPDETYRKAVAAYRASPHRRPSPPNL